MGNRFPQPDNEDDFEQVCLRVYRRIWRNACLKLYGKRGERQCGVDIFDPLSRPPVRAIQCKHHEPTKPLRPATIIAEVQKVEASHFQIKHYVIATTAKKSRNAQDTVAELNLRTDRKFDVDIHYWEDIVQYAGEHGTMVQAFLLLGEDIFNSPESRVALPPYFGDSDSECGEDVFAEIDRHITEGRIEVAAHELERLCKAQVENPSSPFDDYQFLRMRAKVSLENEDYRTAGDLFVQAYTCNPTSIQAKQNLVLGHALLGDSVTAYAQARRFVGEGVHTPTMLVNLIDSFPTLSELEQHQAVIAPAAATDDTVSVALAYAYIRFGVFERAMDAASRAVTISSDSPYTQLAAAFSWHQAALHGSKTERVSRFRTALSHYDLAEMATRRQNLSRLLPEILVNRAAARVLLHDLQEAANDYRTAIAAARHPEVYIERALGFYLHVEDFDNAWKLLDKLDRTSLEAQYLALVTEYRNGDEDEKESCLTAMSELSQMEWDRAIECRFQCVQWLLELRRFADAELYITESFRGTHPFQAYLLLAWIRRASGDDEAALQEAKKALDVSSESIHLGELRILARILVDLGEDGLALDLLEQVASPGIFDEDMKRLLGCAQRLERHDLLLRLCEDLRTSGVDDELLKRLELDLLSRYDPQQAMSLADALVANNAASPFVLATRNLLAVRLNQHDKLVLNPSVLPGPHEVRPEEASMIVHPLLAMRRYDDAMMFLYSLLRHNFDNERAHGAYIYCFLTYGKNSRLRVSSEVVRDTSAALLRSEGKDDRWVVIEDDKPMASRNEVLSSSAIGACLIGSRQGETITLPGNPVQPRAVTICEVQTKYTRAFQDSIQRFAERFSGSSVLQEFEVGHGELFDPAPIITTVRTRREYVEQCFNAYREGLYSLYLLSQRIGCNEFEVVVGLAEHNEGVVKCCHTTPSEFEAAVNAGLRADVIVLSISAIISLAMLDSWPVLEDTKKYVVSQCTIDTIDNWLREAEADELLEGGTLTVEDGNRLVVQNRTPEERTTHVRTLQSLIARVSEKCVVASSRLVAEVPADNRRVYCQVLGSHNLDAMCVAKEHNALLWTDDIVVGHVAAADFCVTTAWTQLMLACGAKSKAVSADEFAEATAKLASWRFGNIVWNAATIVAACKLAEWDRDQWPLRQCLNLLGSSDTPLAQRARIVLGCLQRLRKSTCNELRQTALIQALLDALGSRQAVQWMLHRIDDAFGVDVASAAYVRLELQYWLRFFE